MTSNCSNGLSSGPPSDLGSAIPKTPVARIPSTTVAVSRLSACIAGTSDRIVGCSSRADSRMVVIGPSFHALGDCRADAG